MSSNDVALHWKSAQLWQDPVVPVNSKPSAPSMLQQPEPLSDTPTMLPSGAQLDTHK